MSYIAKKQRVLLSDLEGTKYSLCEISQLNINVCVCVCIYSIYTIYFVLGFHARLQLLLGPAGVELVLLCSVLVFFYLFF